MKNKNKVVLAIFRDRRSVENAVDSLKDSGFRNADISALLPTPDSTKEFAAEKHTKAPEGATTGVASGALLGGTLGWLAGIGTIAIPGVGPFIAAGPIMGLLAGASVGGAAGGIIGALIGMGIPEFEAKRYEGRIKDGGILLSVHCDDEIWEDKAEEILENCGGQDVTCTSESGNTDSSKKVERDIPHLTHR